MPKLMMSGAGAAAAPTPSGKTLRGYTLIVAASDSKDIVDADYICDGVADEVEINQALNALPAAGGIVRLMEGTYNLAASVTIPANDITLWGTGKGTLLQTAANIIMINAIARSTIVISDLHLEGASVSNHGINFTGVTSSIIQNCEINATIGDCIHIENTSDWNKILNNYCRNSKSNSGIKLHEDCSNNTISNNTVESNNTAGIMVTTTNESHMDNNMVTNNTCRANGLQVGWAGIYFASYPCLAYYNIIENNECNDNFNGIQVGSDFFFGVINGNHCNGNQADGLAMVGPRYTAIVGNVCSLNGSEGLYASGLVCCTVVGNILNENTAEGMRCFDPTVNTTIVGNVFYSNYSYGLWLDGSGVNYNTVTGNTFRSNTLGGIYVETSHNNSITGNTFESHSNGPGRDAILLDAADKNIISSNRCLTSSGYGINISNVTSENNIVIGNHIAGNTTGAINDVGANSQIFNNYEDY